MAKSSRARYTLEFKLEAVRMVKGGQSLERDILGKATAYFAKERG